MCIISHSYLLDTHWTLIHDSTASMSWARIYECTFKKKSHVTMRLLYIHNMDTIKISIDNNVHNWKSQCGQLKKERERKSSIIGLTSYNFYN